MLERFKCSLAALFLTSDLLPLWLDLKILYKRRVLLTADRATGQGNRRKPLQHTTVAHAAVEEQVLEVVEKLKRDRIPTPNMGKNLSLMLSEFGIM